jgi:hypothetical protein
MTYKQPSGSQWWDITKNRWQGRLLDKKGTDPEAAGLHVNIIHEFFTLEKKRELQNYFNFLLDVIL